MENFALRAIHNLCQYSKSFSCYELSFNLIWYLKRPFQENFPKFKLIVFNTKLSLELSFKCQKSVKLRDCIRTLYSIPFKLCFIAKKRIYADYDRHHEMILNVIVKNLLNLSTLNIFGTHPSELKLHFVDHLTDCGYLFNVIIHLILHLNNLSELYSIPIL